MQSRQVVLRGLIIKTLVIIIHLDIMNRGFFLFLFHHLVVPCCWFNGLDKSHLNIIYLILENNKKQGGPETKLLYIQIYHLKISIPFRTSLDATKLF